VIHIRRGWKVQIRRRRLSMGWDRWKQKTGCDKLCHRRPSSIGVYLSWKIEYSKG